MVSKLVTSAVVALWLTGCQQTKPQTAAQLSCNPLLASCAELFAPKSAYHIDPIDVHPEDLQYRIAELRRWLSWQRNVQLGLVDEPFESEIEIGDTPFPALIELNLSLSPEDRALLIQSSDQPLLAQE